MPETILIIADSDYAVLVRQGITDAKGSDKAIEFLTEDDLKNLGKLLADREAKIQDLYSVVVDPINNIALAIEKGNYDSVYDWISDDHDRIPLLEAAGAKRIYFVPVTENVDSGDEEAYVNKFGLTLCKSAPNYLTGAMAAVPENKLPAELAGKDFVAAENAESSVFQGKDGRRCFLCVSRDDGRRRLSLVVVDGHWFADVDWMFLAEKP
ncbi:MAG: hypothetical protein ABIO57_03350 [Candidatus Paceibacterota bacterium]